MLFLVDEAVCCTQSSWCRQGTNDVWFCGAIIMDQVGPGRLMSAAVIK